MGRELDSLGNRTIWFCDTQAETDLTACYRGEIFHALFVIPEVHDGRATDAIPGAHTPNRTGPADSILRDKISICCIFGQSQ